MHWLDVPHERQRSSSWCLPACIAMVGAYWEQPLTQEDIARWLGTRDIGTPAGPITQLERRGFAVLYTTGGLEQLRELLAQSVPPILFVHTGDLLPHWRVSVHLPSFWRALRKILPFCSIRRWTQRQSGYCSVT